MPTAFQISARLFAVVCPAALVPCGDSSGKLTYYVPLVRGGNDVHPPEPGGTAIGPKLARPLRLVFSWTNYWEVARQEVAVPGGEKVRVRFSPQREVEIDLATKGKRTVAAFSDGEAVTSVTRPIGESLTIIGGERDKKTACFIVVRRDKPSISEIRE